MRPRREGVARYAWSRAGRCRRRGACGVVPAMANLGGRRHKMARVPARRIRPGLPSGRPGLLGACAHRQRTCCSAALAGSRRGARAVRLLQPVTWDCRSPARTQRLPGHAACDAPGAVGIVRRVAVAGLDAATRRGRRRGWSAGPGGVRPRPGQGRQSLPECAFSLSSLVTVRPSRAVIAASLMRGIPAARVPRGSGGEDGSVA